MRPSRFFSLERFSSASTQKNEQGKLKLLVLQDKTVMLWQDGSDLRKKDRTSEDAKRKLCLGVPLVMYGE